MDLKEQSYKVLVVSASEDFNKALSAMMPVSRYSPVCHASDVSSARRLLNEQSFDFVIINAPLRDDIGINFALDVSGAAGTVTLFIARGDVLAETREKFISAGVFTLTKPLAAQTFSAALDWMMSAREKLRKLETKTLSVEEKIAEIRLVNRAKWLLISELKMEEPQAHHYIEKQAMDRCLSRREIAEEIIKTYS